MKKSIVFLLALCVLFSLSACGGGTSDSDPTAAVESPPVEQTEPDESPHEIPQETILAIWGELNDYFYGYDGASVIAVFDSDGLLDINLLYEGMVLRVPFADYVNALCIQSKELAVKYGEGIGGIHVQFTSGKDKILVWRSDDGVSGTLSDSYDEDRIFLSDQTVDDLVERYGCMNWFYELSEDKGEPSAPESNEDTLPVGPVGGNGLSTVDVTVDLVDNSIDGKAAYDQVSNSIITVIPANGFIPTFINEHIDDPASSEKKWEEAKSVYLDLDNAVRKLINISCNSEVNTTFSVIDNNNPENGIVLIIQNGEVTYSLIDELIDVL